MASTPLQGNDSSMVRRLPVLRVCTVQEHNRSHGLPFRRPAEISAVNRTEELKMMTFDLLVFSPWLSLIAGVSILLVPRLLNYIVAIYLILIGIIGLTAQL
jgi:hypothetical protein